MEPKEVDFEFPRGDTLPIVFGLKDVSDEIVSGLDEIWFTLKKSVNSSEVILQKKLSKNEIELYNGNYVLELSHLDTANLNTGKYYYDIQIKSGTYYKTVFLGMITLTREVTHISNE